MKRILLYLFCLEFGLSGVVADDRPIIPPDVKYKFIDDKLDSSLRTALAAQFAQGAVGVVDLFHIPCVCAPGYWKELSAADVSSFKQPVPSHFSIQNRTTGVKDKLDGATLRDSEDLANLARHFSHDVGLKPIIRRMTTDELVLFWVIYPFDVEEPVYVIQNGKGRFVLCLTKVEKTSEFYASWLDDLTAYK